MMDARILMDRALLWGHDGICMNESEHPIIVFDAQCVLCSANARFGPRYDRRGTCRMPDAARAGWAL